MSVDATQLNWHDSSVYRVAQDSDARSMVWTVEVLLWDIQRDDYVQPGHLVFEEVEQLAALHDLQGAFSGGEVFWDVLKSEFQRHEESVRCEFMLELPRVRNALGSPG